MSELQRYARKTVLVFGAGSDGEGWSNGKAAAVQYAREGAKVLAVDLRDDAATETQEIIRSEGFEATSFAANAADNASVQEAVAACLDTYGAIDVLHNNVGIGEMGGPVETTLESWKRVLDVNMKSVFLTTKHVLPIMEAKRAGAIVNISSIAGIRWSGVSYVGYYASKAGVNQMTRVIAGQYARHGIRCNAIMPGLIDTPQTYKHLAKHYGDGDFERMREARRQQIPMKILGSAWDIAKTAAFLNSDEAKYITGEVVTVDGGMSCSMVAPPPQAA
ncbi:SDR family NAD(P)-dependent oxidoreductase [Marivita hallyeonensis]|uniref:NAD(P)-dependent dehydrogenase, short-chain alcohol dehydrogenase family n=1 Tax=Marivita hallyeonensis TaxID=996342 RepID=A0A1M5XMZ1_9RHOB|nr:SDR family NAD(P)-dependent oxidoreductase [Marivita hallyeonensis]SHI01119.1 NAD(P)-dependent dehydrogenase, short-chain alcohol dehydrogenase family [Marivita hallyeonensis]